MFCSRLCLFLGNGHQHAARHRGGGGRVEPRQDHRQAAGEPCSTDGLQRRAAHGPFGERQPGELILISDREEGEGGLLGKVRPCSTD